MFYRYRLVISKNTVLEIATKKESQAVMIIYFNYYSLQLAL